MHHSLSMDDRCWAEARKPNEILPGTTVCKMPDHLSADAQRVASPLGAESAGLCRRSLIGPFPLYVRRSSVPVLGLDCFFMTSPHESADSVQYLSLRAQSRHSIIALNLEKFKEAAQGSRCSTSLSGDSSPSSLCRQLTNGCCWGVLFKACIFLVPCILLSSESRAFLLN